MKRRRCHSSWSLRGRAGLLSMACTPFCGKRIPMGQYLRPREPGTEILLLLVAVNHLFEFDLPQFWITVSPPWHCTWHLCRGSWRVAQGAPPVSVPRWSLLAGPSGCSCLRPQWESLMPEFGRAGNAPNWPGPGFYLSLWAVGGRASK